MATATTGQQVGSADMLPANREEALKVIQRNFTCMSTVAGKPAGAFWLSGSCLIWDHVAYCQYVLPLLAADTVTIPDDEMLRRMMLASVGDDMNRQDKATIDLEERVAKLAGKEAALFVLSGTMANRKCARLTHRHGSMADIYDYTLLELAIRSQLKQPPHSVIVDSRAHVYRWEAGGVAFHSQATIMPVIASNGRYITWEDIESSLVLEENIHYCPTKLICLENTLHGMIMPQEEVVRISQNAKERSILMHVGCADYSSSWCANVLNHLSLFSAMERECGTFMPRQARASKNFAHRSTPFPCV